MQLRTEREDLANTPVSTAPNTTPTSSAFGQITSTQDDPRRIFVGLRLIVLASRDAEQDIAASLPTQENIMKSDRLPLPSRRSLLTAGAAGLSAAVADAAPAPGKPDVILIISDQFRADCVGAMGANR